MQNGYMSTVTVPASVSSMALTNPTKYSKGRLGSRALVPLKGMKNGGYYDPTDPNA